MNWSWVEKEVLVGTKKKEKLTKVKDYNQQVDEVGNILQKGGGVKPKACQNCKVEFNSKVELFKKTTKVPFYKCDECDMEFGSSEGALDHKIQTNHKLKKELKEKVVGLEKKVTGKIAKIQKTDDDCLILCGDCFGK